MTRKEMEQWLTGNTSLSSSSVYKYALAAETTSKEMIDKGIIPIGLFEMTPLQIDIYLPHILNDPDFIKKNTTGNGMYSNSLKHFRNYCIDICEFPITEEAIIHAINDYNTLDSTERTEIVKSRIGQGVFKKALIKKYESKCIITGITQKKLLIASHVKPWASSNNYERLSVNNGLLLTPTYDKLFDSGLISFRNNGAIMISHVISHSDRQKLGLSDNTVYRIRSNIELSHNLEYHRDIVFIK